MPSSDQSVSTVVLVDSGDISGSVGQPGFLQDRLKPAEGSNPTVEVQHLSGSRCDIVAQRLVGQPADEQVDVPKDLEAWYSTMVAPIEIPDTTSLFIMSMADALREDVWVHRETGVLVQPPSEHDETWTRAQNLWLIQNFELALPTDTQIAEALRSIAKRLESVAVNLVIFNMSTFIPGEKVYWYRLGDPETTSVRAARMNLTVDKLVKELDLALVDVDRITAELGAGVAVTGAARYSTAALEALAEEAIAMILDFEGISRMFAPGAMQLSVPRYDRRTTIATLTRWHVEQGSQVHKGDVLFDVRFGDLHSRLETEGRETGREIAMSVISSRSGFVDRLTVDAGESIAVGTRVGVITSTPDVQWSDVDNAAQFPVGIKMMVHDDE